MRSGRVVSTPMSDCGLAFVYVARDCSQGRRPILNAPYVKFLVPLRFPVSVSRQNCASVFAQELQTLAAVEPYETGRRVGEPVGFALGSP